MLCKMQISILRGCGSKRAEVNINLAWECCTTPAFLQLETSFSLAEEPCSESRGENPPTLIQELSPGRKVAAAAPPVTLAALRVPEG